MNYPESKQILEEVKKAKKILLNCHRGPDPDSIASAFAMKKVLEGLGKEVVIVSPTPPLAYEFLGDVKQIRKLDAKFNFKEFDLIVMTDTENWEHFGVEKRPDNFVVNIDHHKGNRIDGDINIVDSDASSATNVLYKLFKDWGIRIDKELASQLVAGIYADTGIFQYSNTKPDGLRATADLLELGADHEHLLLKLARDNSLDLLKIWGEFLNRIEVDKEHEFVWSAIPQSVYRNYQLDVSPTSVVASLFLRTVHGTNFAVAMTEKNEGYLHMSFRSRINDFDVSAIARQLGGGGHKNASGATIKGVSFDVGVKKVLELARKYAKEYKTRS